MMSRSKAQKDSASGAQTSSGGQGNMARKMFEYENEIIEEELYNFSEAEVDRLMEEKPWRKE